MWTLKHFGQTITSTGSIQEAVNASNLEVSGLDPYVDGQAASMATTPQAGSTVTFRPRASGKAA